jgi:hypothetical protein
LSGEEASVGRDNILESDLEHPCGELTADCGFMLAGGGSLLQGLPEGLRQGPRRSPAAFDRLNSEMLEQVGDEVLDAV